MLDLAVQLEWIERSLSESQASQFHVAAPRVPAASASEDASAALEKADLCVVMSPFKQGLAYADVLLPVSPFTETSGTFVNCEGRAQSFRGVVRPLGETRPAWKVLRVLGTLLGSGFEPERTVLLAFGHDEEIGGEVLVHPAEPCGLEALDDHREPDRDAHRHRDRGHGGTAAPRAPRQVLCREAQREPDRPACAPPRSVR